MGNTNKKSFDFRKFLIQNNTYIIFVILVVVCIALSDKFLSIMNLRNLALQQAAPIIVTLGALFVILTGGIDLSIGSVMAFGACFASIMIKQFNMNFILATLLSMLLGVGLGAFSGVLVAYTHMQGFVATLAMTTIGRGVAFVMTSGKPIVLPDGTLGNYVDAKFGYPIIIIALVLVVIFVILHKYTAFGRIVTAIGSNSTAVELAGIRTKKYLVAVYAMSASLAALAGIFVASRTITGTANIGVGQELDAVTACVIGGTSLSGGSGSVPKAVFGALVLALIGNIMNLLSVPSYPQDIIKGFIIIGAVLLQLAMEKSEKSV